MARRLDGKRVVVTQASTFMGPAIWEVFSEEGAILVADDRDLTQVDAAQNLIDEAGHVDVLVANLAATLSWSSVTDTTDELWSEMFDVMVHPLHRLVRAAMPQMIERRKGKIIVMGSISARRGMPDRSAYSAARGAQLAYVQAVGVEVAPHNVQVNALAQGFVENPSYFSPDYIETPEFKERLKSVPAGRLATAREDALFVLFLASDESDFFVGQVFPFAGGWAT
ncbi:MAG: SDR family oxidoreductase [Rhodospirillaceae bacterium]|nr:SDR family oxidoreductase [Rhodospirillaceae bacterium]